VTGKFAIVLHAVASVSTKRPNLKLGLQVQCGTRMMPVYFSSEQMDSKSNINQHNVRHTRPGPLCSNDIDLSRSKRAESESISFTQGCRVDLRRTQRCIACFCRSSAEDHNDDVNLGVA